MIRKDLFWHVKNDLDERNKIGKRIHGKDLFHVDNHNFLREAYEEALDLVIYLKGRLLKDRDHKNGVQSAYQRTPAGKATIHRYNLTENRNNARERYRKGPKGRAAELKYYRKPERVEKVKWQMRSYRKRNKIRASL
jgi:hypothetical protein